MYIFFLRLDSTVLTRTKSLFQTALCNLGRSFSRSTLYPEFFLCSAGGQEENDNAQLCAIIAIYMYNYSVLVVNRVYVWLLTSAIPTASLRGFARTLGATEF